MERKVCQSNFIYWLLALIYAVAAIAILELLPASAMRFWHLRRWIFHSLGWCFLILIGIALWFLLKRKYRRAIVALCLLPAILVAIVYEGMSIGPDIDDVMRSISETVAISQSEIRCLGGWLRRESTLVFELSEKANPDLTNASQTRNPKNRFDLDSLAARFSVPLSDQYESWCINCDFHILVLVHDNGHWLAFFYGMTQ